MGKRYYWLKLPEDFFGDKAIKRLRKIAGGDTYVIIYLKMMLRSLKDDGYLYYDGLEEDFPAELALDLDEEEDNVQVTLNFLLQHGKLEIRSEQEYFMPDMNIGSETAAAERKRAERERKRQQSLQSNEPETSGCDNVTGVSQMCHGEIDIDREIEKDIYLSIYLRWRIKRKSFNFSTISTTTNAIRGQTVCRAERHPYRCSEVLQLLQRTWMENQERSADYKLERHTGLLGQDRRNLSGQAKAGNLCFRECSSL